MMQFDGTIIVKNDTQVISEKFAKREFVLNDGGDYPQTPIFQLTQDKCDLLDHYEVGDRVIVHININGRAWTNPQGETKYFNSLNVWKIDLVAKGGQAPAPQYAKQQAPSPQTIIDDLEEDTLPF